MTTTPAPENNNATVIQYARRREGVENDRTTMCIYVYLHICIDGRLRLLKDGLNAGGGEQEREARE